MKRSKATDAVIWFRHSFLFDQESKSFLEFLVIISEMVKLMFVTFVLSSLFAADGFVRLGSLRDFGCKTTQTYQSRCQIVRNQQFQRSNFGKKPVIFMGRFDMERPYHPRDHKIFDVVSEPMRPTLPEFISTETNDPALTLLFSSISSAVKSISTLTR